MAQDTTTNYNLDAGDIAYGGQESITLEAADDSDLGGHAVTFDANGQLVTADGNGSDPADFVLGTALDDTAHPDSLTTEKADNYWTVQHGRLPVAVEAEDGYDARVGDFIEPSDDADGTYADAGDVGPDTSLPVIVDEADDDLYIALFG